MNKNDVEAAFDLILAEIDKTIQDLAGEGGEAFRLRNYDEAVQLSQIGAKLGDFQQRVSMLKREWGETFSKGVPRRPRNTSPQVRSQGKKGKRGRLRVTMPSGQVIEEDYGVDTFLRTIDSIGPDRVMRLGLTLVGLPLVSQSRQDSYASQHQLGDYWVVTHASTQHKRNLLRQIAKGLGVSIRVDML